MCHAKGTSIIMTNNCFFNSCHIAAKVSRLDKQSLCAARLDGVAEWVERPSLLMGDHRGIQTSRIRNLVESNQWLKLLLLVTSSLALSIIRSGQSWLNVISSTIIYCIKLTQYSLLCTNRCFFMGPADLWKVFKSFILIYVSLRHWTSIKYAKIVLSGLKKY